MKCVSLSLLTACFLILGSAGCRKNADPTKVKVAYIGLTCEAPIFVAFEKGFFKEEGLDVELVRTDWGGLREGLGLGRYDAIQTLIMYTLKPMEEGLDAKITGGLHTGCLRLQVAANSGIKNVKDLKGKRIGVPTHLGSPPHLFASRVLVANGINPAAERKEVTWVPYQEDVLGKTVADGLVDAIATSDPIGTILVGMGTVRTIADQAADAPYRDEYCCAVAVSGKLARDNPAGAAKVTRALLKAARWVEENTTAAAKLAVEKNYISASIDLNAEALSKLKYIPGVSKCKLSIRQAADEMEKASLLKAGTNPEQLAQRAWLDLEGVTDEWVNNLKVERVLGGGRPARISPIAYALMWQGCHPRLGCCCP